MTKRIEILSPAGDFEKLRSALRFGADAVYLAGKNFGMRAASGNFTVEELYEASRLVHSLGKKMYLTVNVLLHGYEYAELREFLCEIKDAGIDAIIAADLGVIDTVREILPDMPIHISTQASICSPAAAVAYARMGASRLVLARELTFSEIRAIRDAVPEDVELEAFVHGAMCVAYSGRCLLSQMLTGRDANHGACAQPCRWEYSIVEEKRPELPIPIEQTNLGTFIMSSKDMCTIEHIPELIACGIDSFKIEGRVKSAYYTAVVTNAYRMAVDAYLRDPENYKFDPTWLAELESVSHREYGTGFYEDTPMSDPKICEKSGYIREKAYLALAEGDAKAGEICLFRQKNKLSVGEAAEIITPGKSGQRMEITELFDEEMNPIDSAPHPQKLFYARVPFDVRVGDIMRGAD